MTFYYVLVIDHVPALNIRCSPLLTPENPWKTNHVEIVSHCGIARASRLWTLIILFQTTTLAYNLLPEVSAKMELRGGTNEVRKWHGSLHWKFQKSSMRQMAASDEFCNIDLIGNMIQKDDDTREEKDREDATRHRESFYVKLPLSQTDFPETQRRLMQMKDHLQSSVRSLKIGKDMNNSSSLLAADDWQNRSFSTFTYGLTDEWCFVAIANRLVCVTTCFGRNCT